MNTWKKKQLEKGWNMYKGSVSMDEEKEGTFKIPIQKDLVSLRQERTVRFSLTQILIVSVSLIEIMQVCIHIYSYVFFFKNSIWNQETHGIWGEFYILIYSGSKTLILG